MGKRLSGLAICLFFADCRADGLPVTPPWPGDATPDAGAGLVPDSSAPCSTDLAVAGPPAPDVCDTREFSPPNCGLQEARADCRRGRPEVPWPCMLAEVPDLRPPNDLTPEQEQMVLDALLIHASDTWNEGDYEWIFSAFTCDFRHSSCDLYLGPFKCRMADVRGIDDILCMNGRVDILQQWSKNYVHWFISVVLNQSVDWLLNCK